MNNNDADTALLIQYLDGELEGDLLIEVRNRIANSPTLQQELESLQAGQMAIKSYGLRQRIGGIHAQMMDELKESATTKAPVRKMLAKGLRVAASIIVLVGLVTIYQYYSLSSNRLFEANYQPYALHESRGEKSSSSLEETFKQHLPGEVIQQFSELRQPTITDYFYVANAYLQEHRGSEAVQSFLAMRQKNAENKVHVLEDDSEYYLAMSYLQNNEPCNALSIFNKIEDDKQHLYHDKVSSLFLLKVKLLCKK